MNTTQLTQALEKSKVHALQVNKAFEKEFNFTIDDLFAVVEEQTPFKLQSTNHKGFPSSPWISLK